MRLQSPVTLSSAEAPPVRRSTRRNSMLPEACVGTPVRRSTRRNSVGVVEAGAVDRKQKKQRSQEKKEETAIVAEVGVPCRVTRRSSLLPGVTLLPVPPLDTKKKRGRGKTADGKNEFDGKACVSAGATSAVAESRRNGMKRRKTTESEQIQEELPAILEVPTKDAPVIKTLRNRVVQVPSKCPPLRRSRRSIALGSAEVSPIVSSCYNGITVMVTKPQFVGHEDSKVSESSPHVSDSIQESHSVGQKFQTADVEKCLSKDIKGNPLLPNLHSDGADADRILPALDASKESSSDGGHSSFGLSFLLAEERKENSSRSDINTVVEVDDGSKPSASITPSFCMKSDCGLQCEIVQALGHDAERTLDVGQGVAQEEFIAVEMSGDEHVAPEIDMKTESNYEADCHYVEADCILTEKNMRLVADNHDDEHAAIQIKECAIQEGTLEKSSLRSTAPERKQECRLPEEAELHSIGNKRCSSRAEQSPLEISHEGELVSSSLPVILVDANHRKEVIKSVELVCKGEGNRNNVQSEDLNTSREKSEVGMSDRCLRHTLLNDLSVERSLEESAMSVVESVSNACTVGNPSSDSALYEHKDGSLISFEEIERKVKNCVGDCPSNPKELLLQLQSTPSKGDIDESDLDSLALPNSGFVGDESAIVERVLVHLDSDLTQLKPNDLLDELLQCSNTGVLPQGHKNQRDSESTEEQIGSAPWTSDSTDAATVKRIESEVDLLPVEERSKLQDKQLSTQESPKAVESSLNNDVRDILHDGSIRSVCYEKFLFGEKSDSTMGGTARNSLFVLTPSNKKHGGMLSEEVANAVNNYVGTCPSNPRELFMELQSPNETFEDVNPRDNPPFPNTEREGDESTICHLDNLLGKVLSSEPESYLGPSKLFSRDEGKQGCMSVSLHEDEGLLKSNYLKDTNAHLPGHTHNVGRDSSTEEVLCAKKEKMESTQSSDCDILHENSHSKGCDENHSKTCNCDAQVLCQDRVQECHKVNEYEVLPAVLENDISEAGPVERMESKIMLDGEVEKYSFECDKNMGEILYNGSVKNSMSEVPKDCHLNSCQKPEVPDVLSGPKCPEEFSHCQNECILGPGTGTSHTSGQKFTNESSSPQLTSHIGLLDQEKYNENNRHQTTPGFPATGMSEGALLKRSGSVVDAVSAGGSSALPDEQLNVMLVGPEMVEHNCIVDRDTSSLFDPEMAGKSKASNLPENTQSDPSSEHDL